MHVWLINQEARGQPTVPAPPDQQEGACTFTLPMSNNAGVAGPLTNAPPNTYWFGDAILIRNYNGAYDSYRSPGGAVVGRNPSPNYISWQNSGASAIPYWRFFKPNIVASDTVQDVCNCTTPNSASCTHDPALFLPWLTPQTSIAPSTQTPGALTVQFNLVGVPAVVNLTSSNPQVFPVPAQVTISAATTFGFDVAPTAVTSPTLIQVTASTYGTTATASLILQPQQ